MIERKTILEIKNLSIKFQMYQKGLKQTWLNVISNLSISMKEGEILAIAGSSGSGKSLLAHSILGILPKNALVEGEMVYKDKVLTPKEQERLRGKEIALVPQSVVYLDPLMNVQNQVIGTSGTMEKQRRVFKKYQLEASVEKMYPFQLSGGMARRVLVSTAVMNDATILVADEPTPGLGQEMAADTMAHFRQLADEGCSVLLITHDIDFAFHVADRVAVLYGGTIVEVALAQDFIKGQEALRHPYSKALWEALPQNGFKLVEGTQPYAGDEIKGCIYGPRCPRRTPECFQKIPIRKIRDGEVACIHAT